MSVWQLSRWWLTLFAVGAAACSSSAPLVAPPVTVVASTIPPAVATFGAAADPPAVTTDDVVFMDEPAAQDPVLADPVVADPVVVDPVVAEPAPSTTQDASKWAIPVRTTLPYVVPSAAQLPVAGSVIINQLAIPVPANWLVLQSADDVAAAAGLNEQLRASFTSSFATDLSRGYLIPADEQTLSQPTTILVVVRSSSPVAAEDGLLRLIERSKQNDGFKTVSKGRSDWLGARASGVVLEAADGRVRCIRVVRLKDQRLVILQADGTRPDLQAIHAQFAELMVESAEPFA